MGTRRMHSWWAMGFVLYTGKQANQQAGLEPAAPSRPDQSTHASDVASHVACGSCLNTEAAAETTSADSRGPSLVGLFQ